MNISNSIADIPYIQAVLLAAGESKRFKINKLLVSFNNDTILIKSLKNLLKALTGIIAVTLRYDQNLEEDLIIKSLSKKDLKRVTIYKMTNNNRKDSSLPGFLKACSFNCNLGILVYLADLPFIKQETIKIIYEKGLKAGPDKALAPIINQTEVHPEGPTEGRTAGHPVGQTAGHPEGQTAGHPVWIGKNLFKLIYDSKAGEKNIKIKNILKKSGKWNTILVNDSGILKDIDRKEDLKMLPKSWFSPQNIKILVRGAGDLASGVIYRLFKAGFDVCASEIDPPLTVRLDASFSKAVLKGKISLQGISAVKCTSLPDKNEYLNKYVPVIIQKDLRKLDFLPNIIVDARMTKKKGFTEIDCPLIIGLGPGFKAGSNCNYVIETMRGMSLGSVISEGEALKDTGSPAPVSGHSLSRLVKSPETGIFKANAKLGDLVKAGDLLGTLIPESSENNSGSIKIKALIAGLLRGLIADSSKVTKGMKIGDIDPRGSLIKHNMISDKALSIGGAVLEAVMYHYCNPEKK